MTVLSDRESADLVCVELARRLVGCERVLLGVNTPLAEAAALLAHRVTGTPGTVITGAVSGTHQRPTVVRVFEAESHALAHGAAWPFEQLLLGLPRRRFDAEPVRPLQLDRAGRLCLSGIRDDGRWKLLGPGPAGLDLLPYLARRYVCYVSEHSPRVFADEISRADTPGVGELVALGGPGALTVISPLAVIEITPEHAVLVDVRAGCTVRQVRCNTGFALDEPPGGVGVMGANAGQLSDALDEVDPGGCRHLEFMPLAARLEALTNLWRQEAEASEQ